ncbi:MAG: NAD(P)/FAD-dependent oxidoreductase [Clostridiales bacterium]|jgi:protoporphyrinogen oxidase|nr:NAD(P)/FAD-dependent oxidoreductase [Clostridiales bacterium]
MKKAVIIGAGPSGLSAAYQMLKSTDVKPVIYELSNNIGGISQTVNFNGNRMDLGGHRFFSKSDEVMDFWKEVMPFSEDRKNYRALDKIFMTRNRVSRILYMRKFFDYPVTLSYQTIKNLGFIKTMKIGFSYLSSLVFKKKEINSLEDFFISRFGRELYKTFFKEYTEKVWGMPCSEISPDWGAQRVKGLSIMKAIIHAIKKPFLKINVRQKNLETTLIEKFLYPKYGPGEFWEEVAARVQEKGGEIYKNSKIIKIYNEGDRIVSVDVLGQDGDIENVVADYFISSMPVKDLINSLESVPGEAKSVADGLLYRDFIAVGVLLKNINLRSTKNKKRRVKDNWIYIQEPDVKLGRVQIFNNWSPFMVKDKRNIFIGLEYFCNEGDDLWSMGEKEFTRMAISELVKLGIANKKDIIEAHVVKAPKAYPAYFGSYSRFDVLKSYTDKFKNLYLVGRNGQHRYNNMDHSILTAFEAVKNINSGYAGKENIWAVNSEESYHESK